MATIDYGKIVTNAVSALVAAVFVGAGAIVWKAATTVDERIDEANGELAVQQGAIQTNQEILKEQQTGLKATQETILGEVTDNAGRIALLESSLEELSSTVSQLAEGSSENGVEVQEHEPAIPLTFNPRDAAALTRWKAGELDRIKGRIDTRQMALARGN